MCEFTLFFYGTLRAAEIRSAVLGHDLPTGHLTDAVLENYQVRRVKGALYPLLVPAAGEKAIGLLATSLDRQAIQMLDQFEGNHYNRAALQVCRPVVISQLVRRQSWKVSLDVMPDE